MRRRGVQPNQEWPAWRYGPSGESAIFQSEEEVPNGWTKKPGIPDPEFVARAPVALNRDDLVAKLSEIGVEINPTWGNAHMKRIIDGDVSPTG